jgi:hypothetical protein
MSTLHKLTLVLLLVTPIGLYFVPSSPTIVPTAHAASFTAVQSGHWDNPATWGGSVPTSTDDVTIPAGIAVTIPNGLTVNRNSWINNYGTLINNGSISIVDARMNNMGVFTNNSTFYGLHMGHLGDWLQVLYNEGIMTNNGEIHVEGGGFIDNVGTLTNYDTIHTPVLDNYDNGNFINEGVFYSYFDIWWGEGSITNNGILNINNGSSFGSIINNGTFHVASASTFTNRGIFDNYNLLNNEGEVINDSTYGSFYNYCNGVISGNPISGNPVIEINDCPPTPTATPPSPVVIGCDSSDFPKYGLALVTTQQMGYDAPNGEPARDTDGNTLWLLRDADGDGDDTYVISEIMRGTNGETWLGLYMGGCDLVYVPLSEVLPLQWIPEP